MTTEEVQCGTTLHKIDDFYRNNINGRIDILICAIGMISNLLNILVFTRKNVISPVNLIFTHLAFADLASLLGSCTFSWIISVQRGEWTYKEAAAFLWGSNFSNTLHFASVFFTVQLAIWRYIAIAYPLKERQWCSMRITRNVVIIGYLISILLGIPTYVSRSIKPKNQIPNYTIARTENWILYLISRIMMGVVGALLPSTVLTMFSLRLIIILLSRKTHREKSISHSNVENRTKQIDRSVTVLLTVLVLFLMAELPKGIAYSMAIIQDIRFRTSLEPCYIAQLRIYNFIGCINKSITFVGYYIMSQQFRIILKSLFNCNTIPGQMEVADTSRGTKRSELCSENDQFLKPL